MNKLFLTVGRTLTLAAATQPGRPAYFSAASGLVHVDSKLYVVADDESYLGIFPDSSNEHGVLKQLSPKELPLEKDKRKAKKPDFEVLAFIPCCDKHPHGALLALGSGSRKARKKGAIIAFDKHGNLHDKVKHLDLSFAYEQFRDKIEKLNIEGAVIVDDDIILFQRGNNTDPNATLRCKADTFFSAIDDGDKKLDVSIRQYDLGEIDGIPLCFTDATTLPDGTVIFVAAAEDTSDSYLDGKCAGSTIGVITREGELGKITPVDKIIKIEGIAAKVVDGKVNLIMVTDADDVAIAAQVYSAKVDSML